jgi:hypothetical protein
MITLDTHPCSIRETAPEEIRPWPSNTIFNPAVAVQHQNKRLDMHLKIETLSSQNLSYNLKLRFIAC